MVREREKWRTVGRHSRRRERKALDYWGIICQCDFSAAVIYLPLWFICRRDLSAAIYLLLPSFCTWFSDMSRSLCHLNGSVQWLSATPYLPILQIVPGKGKPLAFPPDHLLASSPLLRDLLPAGWIFSFPLIHHVQKISNLRFLLVFTVYLHAGCLRGRS